VEDSQPSIAHNLDRVRERIRIAAERCGRSVQEIQIVAISKEVGADRMLEALALGVKALGENRVQDAREKWPMIDIEMRRRACEFHMVGHLQTNKAKEAVRLFDLIHSLDSERLARELEQRAGEAGKLQRVLIEVNTSQELTKFGIEPQAVQELVTLVRSLRNLRLEGLMTIGPLTGGVQAARECFRMLRNMRHDLGGREALPILSMGMTQDFETAIEEGADMVRIGTAIFGGKV